MRYRDYFRIFPRSLPSGRTVFYYTAYDELGRRKQFSTGKRTRTEAQKYCVERFRKGFLIPSKDYTLREYTADWWVWDRCPYIKARSTRGFATSHSYADRQRAILTAHILSSFGQMKIASIRPGHIEAWLHKLKDKGMASISINHCLSCLKVILGEAERLRDIEENPAKVVKPLAEHMKEKGILTLEEVQKLLGEGSLDAVWKGNRLMYLLNLTASLTGMRMGEIQALRKDAVKKDHLEVKHSWDRKYGLKCTKTGENRSVPLPAFLVKELRDLSKTNSGPYVFSTMEGEQPVDNKWIVDWLYRGFLAIGIPEKKRKARNITFHSWRHFFNSRLRGGGLADCVYR